MSAKLPRPSPLSPADFQTVVRLAPLVSIDLIIRNAQGEILLGLRANEPAKGFYFVPGGIVLKHERLRDAFARILKRETNCDGRIEDARLLGAFEHFYETNSFGDAAFGTHYQALANSVLDIGYGFVSRRSLTDTTGNRRAFDHPRSIFVSI